jgi:NUMOD4 motif/HNH endonuclease
VTKLIEEIWKPINEFIGLYEISNLGRVRSLDREITVQSGHHQKRRYRGRILKGSTDAHGYQRICLWRGNKQTGAIVHRLVLEAFVRKMEADEEGNHLDFDKRNCALENLEISTTAENMSHATNAGRMAKKLTDDQVRQIKRSLDRCETRQSLAYRFGVSYRMIRLIDIGELWRRVEPRVSR